MKSNELKIRSLPCWKGGIAIVPLHGGISNESYLVTDGAGRHVVRFGADYPFHHVSRDREIMTAKAAHEAGFAPRLEYSAPGVMVMAHVESRTCGAADVRANPERIGVLIRRFHEEMPRHVTGPGFMFWVFHVIRDYAHRLERSTSRAVAALPGYLKLAGELELAQVPLPIVFGHNDLLPANFLDDGERLWLIDFEYAGFNTAMFDLAGTASNAQMSEEEANRLLRAYFDRDPDEAIVRSFAAMQCASLLREAMWSMVSELFLKAPGVDYAAYTNENLARLGAALDRYRMKYGSPS